MKPTLERGLEVRSPAAARESFRRLAERSAVRGIRKSGYVFREGERPEHLFYLLEGRVKIGTPHPVRRQVVKEIIYPGELFGESAVFESGGRSDFALAVQASQVAVIAVDTFRRRLEEDHALALAWGEWIGRKAVLCDRWLHTILFRDARTRIVEFLRMTALDHGEAVGDEILVRDFTMTHRDMADLSGTSRQTVTEVLRELRERKLIFADRRNLLVRDMKHL